MDKIDYITKKKILHKLKSEGHMNLIYQILKEQCKGSIYGIGPNGAYERILKNCTHSKQYTDNYLKAWRNFLKTRI